MALKINTKEGKTNSSHDEKTKDTCGIVMPISSIDGCTESHWTDVLDILTESISDAGFEPNVVSNADDVGIIQKRIIQNLYDNPVVVCDVSGKNPNVMFELGLRLAFDKPTIIVKDDKTAYTFDTSNIEHLQYPRDLRFSKIVDFKKKLTEKIVGTYEKAKSDPNYTTFLKHFGEFTVAKLEEKEVPGQEFILEELRNVRLAIQSLGRGPSQLSKTRLTPRGMWKDICLQRYKISEERVLAELEKVPGVSSVVVNPHKDHVHISVEFDKRYHSEPPRISVLMGALFPETRHERLNDSNEKESLH